MGERNCVKYRLEMTEEQARTVIAALDLANRIRLGQWGEIVEHCMEWDKETETIESWSMRRDDAEALLLQARDIVMPDLRSMHSLVGGHGVYAREETERAYNVLLAVRSAIAWHNNPNGDYTVDFRRPMAIHINEEMPRCEVW